MSALIRESDAIFISIICHTLVPNRKTEHIVFFLCVFTAARRAPPLAAGSRRSSLAAVPEPNCRRLGHTPEETTHAVAKVLAQQRSLNAAVLAMPLLAPATGSLLSAAHIGNIAVLVPRPPTVWFSVFL